MLPISFDVRGKAKRGPWRSSLFLVAGIWDGILEGLSKHGDLLRVVFPKIIEPQINNTQNTCLSPHWVYGTVVAVTKLSMDYLFKTRDNDYFNPTETSRSFNIHDLMDHTFET